MAGLYTIRELIAFQRDLLVVLFGMFWDRIWRARGMPRTIKDLTPAKLSELMGEEIVAIKPREDRKAAMDGDVSEIGAGGTGTMRAWLELTYKDGRKFSVFIKVPSTQMAERLFLTVFDIYPNETRFYMHTVRSDHCPRHLFSNVLHVSARGHRFCLILEDLSKRGAAFPHILDDYPRERLNAVIESFSTMHAAFYERPPNGCWCDRWSCSRTVPPTPAGNRPAFRRLVAEHTLKVVEKRYPGLIPRPLYRAYVLFIANFERMRRIWSSGKLTLAHGDSHLGNIFFAEGKAGFIDMQCVSAEPPMRDLTYHLCCSYDSDALAREEKDIIKQYVASLNNKLKDRGLSDQLTFEEAWDQYRSLSWWALAAFLISAGASDLMKAEVAVPTCNRICETMMRIDAVGKLYDEVGIPR